MIPNIHDLIGVTPFEKIYSYRLTYPSCCRLSILDQADKLLMSSPIVDSLDLYSRQMWDMITWTIGEKFRIRLFHELPWDGPCYLPYGLDLRLCLNRHSARAIRNDIEQRYLSRPDRLREESMSVFAGYGVLIPNDMQRERDAMEFLARQAEHFESIDDYIFIVQEIETPPTSLI